MEINDESIINFTHIAISKTLDINKPIIWNDILHIYDLYKNTSNQYEINFDIQIYDPTLFSITYNLSQIYVLLLDQNNKVFYLPIVNVLESFYHLHEIRYLYKIGHKQFLNLKINTKFKNLYPLPESNLFFIYSNPIKIKEDNLKAIGKINLMTPPNKNGDLYKIVYKDNTNIIIDKIYL